MTFEFRTHLRRRAMAFESLRVDVTMRVKRSLQTKDPNKPRDGCLSALQRNGACRHSQRSGTSSRARLANPASDQTVSSG
jgi:hypothetical protein